MSSDVTIPRTRGRRLKVVEGSQSQSDCAVEDSDARSLHIIRAEYNLSRFRTFEERVIVRMIEACGIGEIADDVVMSSSFAVQARLALLSSASILCDTNVVATGIARHKLPSENTVVCKTDREECLQRAKDAGVAPEAAAVDFWQPELKGGVVVIGSSAQALRRLITHLNRGWPKPAAIIGLPAGFGDAPDAKAELVAHGEVPFLTIAGRKGGSVIAAAALNALASIGE
jgi:precorrin-8X/cobalt-precorrin-8 methylmutase